MVIMKKEKIDVSSKRNKEVMQNRRPCTNVLGHCGPKLLYSVFLYMCIGYSPDLSPSNYHSFYSI